MCVSIHLSYIHVVLAIFDMTHAFHSYFHLPPLWALSKLKFAVYLTVSSMPLKNCTLKL